MPGKKRGSAPPTARGRAFLDIDATPPRKKQRTVQSSNDDGVSSDPASDTSESLKSDELKGRRGLNNMVADHMKRGRRTLDRFQSRQAVPRAVASLDVTPIDTSVTFANSVGGLRRQIQQVLELMILPAAYPTLFHGCEEARGVLFTGPPGCGKTLVARAIAAEYQKRMNAPVSLFVRKGADLLAKYVGQSEANLQSLFASAQQSQPSIIFFDEIDGLVPVRNSEHDHVHASVTATLLALMDGLQTRGSVLVIGATNRPDALDPALRRPGRFDKELHFTLPDANGRVEMLTIHTKKWYPASRPKKADKLRIAAATDGFSGADIKMLTQEARALAVRRSYPEIFSHPERLLVSEEQLEVQKVDWDAAIRCVQPSQQRSSTAASAQLPPSQPHLQDLVREDVEALGERIRRCFPAGFPPKDVIYSSHFEPPPTPGRLLIVSTDESALAELVSGAMRFVSHCRTLVMSTSNMLKDGGVRAVDALASMLRGPPGNPCAIMLCQPENWMHLLDLQTRTRLISEIKTAKSSCVLVMASMVPAAIIPHDDADQTTVDVVDCCFRDETCRYLAESPCAVARQRFFSSLAGMLQRPPPIAISAADLRSDIAVSRGRRQAPVVAQSLEKQRLVTKRREALLARTMLRTELRHLLEKLVNNRGHPPSGIFASAEELMKRLVCELKAGIDLRKEIHRVTETKDDRTPIFYTDFDERHFVTVSVFTRTLRDMQNMLEEYFDAAELKCSRELKQKLRSSMDFASISLNRLNSALVFETESLWSRQSAAAQAVLDHAKPDSASECCPICGLDDFTRDTPSVTCVDCGTSWHTTCTMPETAELSDWRCVACVGRSGRKKKRPVQEEDESSSEASATGPFVYEQKPVTGVDLGDVLLRVVNSTESFRVSDLESVWISVSEAVWEHRNEVDKKVLSGKVRDILTAFVERVRARLDAGRK